MVHPNFESDRMPCRRLCPEHSPGEGAPRTATATKGLEILPGVARASASALGSPSLLTPCSRTVANSPGWDDTRRNDPIAEPQVRWHVAAAGGRLVTERRGLTRWPFGVWRFDSS